MCQSIHAAPESDIETGGFGWFTVRVRVLVIGCGYVGLPLGLELVREGHSVFGIRRSTEGAATLAKEGISPLTADISRRGDLEALGHGWDWIVNTTSSNKGGAAEYQQVYFEGTRNLLGWLATSPPKKYIYTGSSSVYGQTDGSQVKETSPARAGHRHGADSGGYGRSCCWTRRAGRSFPPCCCAWPAFMDPAGAIYSCNI